MQEILFVNPAGRLANPHKRKHHHRHKNASPAQRAWRKRFGQIYGGKKHHHHSNPGKKAKHKHTGVMQSVKHRSGKSVSRAAWHHSGYRRNPSRRRNAYLMNPTFRGGLAGITGMLTSAATKAAGATLVDLGMGQLIARGVIPAAMLSAGTYPLVKGAVAIALGTVVNMLPLPRMLHGFGSAMAEGSLIVTFNSAIKSFLPSTMTLGARRRMGYWQSGQTMGEYLHRYPKMLGDLPLLKMRENQAWGPGYSATGFSEYLGGADYSHW